MIRAATLAISFALSLGAASVHAWAAGLERHSFELDGHAREYLLYAPANLTGPRPLVLVLHGGGGTHRNMARMTHGRWQELADRHGFLVAYPNALDRMWDFGEGVVSENLDVRVDDLAYFREVIARIMASGKVDPDRVFSTGISRGGQASYFLACHLPGTIRAIAPVTMPLPAFLEDDCRNGPPVGLVLINGTADPLVPYDGGDIRVFRRKRGKVLSTDRTIALWRLRNGCADAPDTVENIDRPGDATTVARSDWTACTGAPVTLYRVEGGGHTWPSGRQYLGRRLVGEVSHDIDGAEEIWRFFARF